jgi:hypothetical protein
VRVISAFAAGLIIYILLQCGYTCEAIVGVELPIVTAVIHTAAVKQDMEDAVRVAV